VGNAWTELRAVFASGSPFNPVKVNSRLHVPGQGNHAYILPGVGPGIVCTGTRRATDSMFIAASHTLAGLICENKLAEGRAYPALKRIHEVSLAIWRSPLRSLRKCLQKINTKKRPADRTGFITVQKFQPQHPSYCVG